MKVTQPPQGLNPADATPETSEPVSTSSWGHIFFLQFECFWSIYVQYIGMFPIQNIYNKHPSGKSKEQILAGGMETRKTNRFWKLRVRAAEGKPTYQNSRVKGIIKINKSSSEKLKLYTNEENRNVPEIWKVTHKNKQGRPKEQLAKAQTSKPSLLQPQQKQCPRGLMGPQGDPHETGTRKIK